MMNESSINEGMLEIDDIGVASRIHMVHHAKGGETPEMKRLHWGWTSVF